MDERRLLPIKVVSPRRGDTIAPPPGGGGSKPLCEVTPELRHILSEQVDLVVKKSTYWFSTHKNIPAVGKVRLKEKAVAKSHRPTRIFNEDTCPIIGVKGLGELLIQLTPIGLENLKNELIRGVTKKHIHNISTIENISLYSSLDVLDENTELQIKNVLEQKRPIKIELFDYNNSEINNRVRETFGKYLKEIGCELEKEIYYSETLTVFKINCQSLDSIVELKKFAPIRRVSFFPQFRPFRTIIRPQDLPVDENTWAPREGTEYPVVGIVDSGIPINHNKLSQWIIGRENYVPVNQNFEHGTFVGGIVTHAHHFNDDLIDGVEGCQLLDVCVLPNDDPEFGPVEIIYEDVLLERIEDAVDKHYEHVKVWNLSFNCPDSPCNEFKVSDFAAALDRLSDQYNVCFVISAGNYEDIPSRSWPPQPHIGDHDRITSPSDSIRSITVGSLAYKEKHNSAVKCFEPSPFSRRGPGPAYIIKPDLVHDGGNCTLNGDFEELGVYSWSVAGGISESTGTSFSAPRVSRLLASVYHGLDQVPSLNLAKALLIHSANIPGKDRRPCEDELHYYGFGMPKDLGTILSCTDTSITLIWESQLLPGMHFDIRDFPYPRCLYYDDTWHGNVTMTLVYNPPLDHREGFECCRINLDASLGLLKFSPKDKKWNFKGQVPPDAQWNDRYEKNRVEHGFKWSPIKVYRRDISEKGIMGKDWRLLITPLTRFGEDIVNPQDFAILITISDPNKKKPVYSDVVQQLQQRFTISDLAVNNRIRSSLGL